MVHENASQYELILTRVFVVFMATPPNITIGQQHVTLPERENINSLDRRGIL